MERTEIQWPKLLTLSDMFTTRPTTFPYTLAWAFRSATKKTQNTGVKDKSYIRNARHERDGARDLSRRIVLLFPLALVIFDA